MLQIFIRNCQESVYSGKTYFLVCLLVWFFFSCSLAWNKGSIVTFSYMNVDIFNQVYPTVLFCPSYSEKTGSSFQMILLYSHVFFLYGPMTLMRIAHSGVYERSFTGAWETYQWLYYWKCSLLPFTAIINCLGDHPSSMMECWWAQSCTGLMQAGIIVILLNSQHLWLFVHIWFIKIDHVDKKISLLKVYKCRAKCCYYHSKLSDQAQSSRFSRNNCEETVHIMISCKISKTFYSWPAQYISRTLTS